MWITTQRPQGRRHRIPAQPLARGQRHRGQRHRTYDYRTTGLRTICGPTAPRHCVCTQMPLTQFSAGARGDYQYHLSTIVWHHLYRSSSLRARFLVCRAWYVMPCVMTVMLYQIIFHPILFHQPSSLPPQDRFLSSHCTHCLPIPLCSASPTQFLPV